MRHIPSIVSQSKLLSGLLPTGPQWSNGDLGGEQAGILYNGKLYRLQNFEVS